MHQFWIWKFILKMTLWLLIPIGIVYSFHNYSNGQEAIKFGATVFGAAFGLYQLQRHYDWNRRKAAAEANSGFLAPHMQIHWKKIHEPVLLEKKKYKDLSDSQQESVRALLTYLESVGLLIKHDIVERVIVYELLSSALPILYDCASEYISEIRKVRENKHIFEHVVREASVFTRVNDDLKQKELFESGIGPLPPFFR